MLADLNVDGKVVKAVIQPTKQNFLFVFDRVTGKPVTLFGDDYATPDGTCIRDYIHVTDLAQAHVAAVEALAAGSESKKYNVGTGFGYSVKEVLNAVEKVTGAGTALVTVERGAFAEGYVEVTGKVAAGDTVVVA